MTQQELQQFWLAHIFKPAAQVVQGVGSKFDIYVYDTEKTQGIIDAVKEILDMIINRTFDSQFKLDDKIVFLSNTCFSNKYDGLNKYYLSTNEIADIISDMCVKCGIFWDDSLLTTFEIDAFKKTILGDALASKNRLLSDANAVPASAANATSAASATSAATSVKSTSPKATGTWQSRGALSDQARGLIGAAHQKINPNTTMYSIYDENVVNKAGTKHPFICIYPLHDKGDAGNNKNKIFCAFINNFGDCKCLFDSATAAQDFVDTAMQKGLTVTSPKIKQERYDGNGYFKLDTELGPVYLRAFEFNEELVREELEESGENVLEAVEEEKVQRGTKEFNDMLDEASKDFRKYFN